MSTAVKRHLRAWVTRKERLLPAGFSWPFVVTVDVAMIVIGAVATVQRPVSDWPIAIVAMVIAFSPWIVFFLCNVVKHEGPALWTAWMLATAIMLFATSTPINGDFAPLLLILSVGVISAITSTRGGVVAASSATALLGCAAALHRLDTPVLYLAFVGIGWLVGYLMRIQQELLLEQRQMQAKLAALAAADERRRIAHEVHDVIAHTLSITLLHLTGARHTLEHDGDAAAVVRALHQAERQGRQAMADIRRTVGLLDADPTARAPEPGISDITALTEDFSRAGLDVVLTASGPIEHVSGAVGLALYRITQESLSNVAKHASDSQAAVTLTISPTAVQLSIVNQLPQPGTPVGAAGRGLRGMRQRIEPLGGTIDAGPSNGQWAVHVAVPAGADDPYWTHRKAAS
ncbi:MULTISPECIES: sensor histidine kinase [unclassified Mycobacterium]|uniref:sensor histidine kinase n=1 Tax=unclassified Mycobacterium TaxID=2642494 RepID=UPI0029C8E09C|nr:MULTISPECIES: histidine kinase [unclassified Mycobacterium]